VNEECAAVLFHDPGAAPAGVVFVYVLVDDTVSDDEDICARHGALPSIEKVTVFL
jgi:hypothetical protein